MLAWVKSASITRILPDRFHIELVERELFALWRQDESLYLIDRDGVKITRNYLTRFHHLPTMEGENSHLYAAQFMDLLTAYPVLRNRMVGARRYGDRRWTVFLDHGGAVHLPAEMSKSLKAFDGYGKRKRVLALHGRAIDLRMEDRVLLRALPLPTNKKKIEKANMKPATRASSAICQPLKPHRTCCGAGYWHQQNCLHCCLSGGGTRLSFDAD